MIRKFVVLGHQAIDAGTSSLATFATPLNARDPNTWPTVPLGWNRAAATFREYRVIGAKLTVSLIGAGISAARELWGVKTMSESARATLFHGLNTRILQTRGLLGNAICIAGANRFTGVKSLQTVWSQKRWFPKGQDVEGLFALTNGGVGGPPTSPGVIVTVPVNNLDPMLVIWYANLEGANGGSRIFDFKLEVVVQFREPTP